jgi:Spy/CpxP family protein refolding chaperone
VKLAALVLTATMMMYAQPPGRGARGAAATTTAMTLTPPTDAVKTYLTLTDSQMTGFAAIRQTAMTAGQPLADQIRTKSQALQTALSQTTIDTTLVASLRAAITALQSQIDKIQSDARVQMVALLSAAQKTKLATLEAAAALRNEVQGAAIIGLVDGGQGGPGFGGPGGPGGRGPGGRPNF